MKPITNRVVFCTLMVCCGISNDFDIRAQEFQPGTYDDIRVALMQPLAAPGNQISGVADKPASAKGMVKKPTAIVNYDIYRDRSPLPVDPRKPCNECVTRQDDCCKKCRLSAMTGFQGRPFRDREPGGCQCGKCCTRKKKRPRFSVYWPAVFNAFAEERHPEREACRAANLNYFRINNLFDRVAGFELCGYERCDNGHTGRTRDRYGCLGESRYLQSNVGGVGLRIPGQPLPRGGIEYP